MISLLDTAGHEVATWYVIFQNRSSPVSRWLKHGFEHVQLWRPTRFGPGADDIVWLFVDPCMELIKTGILWGSMPPWELYPEATVQKVTMLKRSGRVREKFFAGPVTCVELAKAYLGIQSFWIRTPYQLYRRLSGEKYGWWRWFSDRKSRNNRTA